MPASWTASVNWQRINDELSELDHGQKSAYIRALERQTGKSRTTIYRALSRACGPKKECLREAEVDVRLIHEIMRLKVLSRILRSNGNRELATLSCIALLKKRGHPGVDALTVSTVNRTLRRLGFRQRKRRRHVVADYACQMFQMDFSRSKFFQVTKPTPDGDWLLRVSSRELHYKDPDADRRMRTWLVQVLDVFSGLRLVRAYAAAAESYMLGLEFLGWCFNRPMDEHMMQHLMEALRCDNGAFRKKTEVKTIAEALGFSLPATRPGAKETQGRVERGWGTLWQQFEQELATDLTQTHGPGVEIRLSAYNQALHAFTTAEHERPHVDYPAFSRGELYQQSVLKRRPPKVEVDLLRLSFQVFERTVNTYAEVAIDNVKYRVPERYIGQRVRIFLNRNGDLIGEPIQYWAKPFKVTISTPSRLGDYSDTPRLTLYEQVERGVKSDLKAQGKKRTIVPLLPQSKPAPINSPFVEPEVAPQPVVMNKPDTLAFIGRTLKDGGYPDELKKLIFPTLKERVDAGLTQAEAFAIADTLLKTYMATTRAS